MVDKYRFNATVCVFTLVYHRNQNHHKGSILLLCLCWLEESKLRNFLFADECTRVV
jgi:hypothetical protein